MTDKPCALCAIDRRKTLPIKGRLLKGLGEVAGPGLAGAWTAWQGGRARPGPAQEGGTPTTRCPHRQYRPTGQI